MRRINEMEECMKVAMRIMAFALSGIATLTAGIAQETPADIYEAAKKEGKVIIWSSLDVEVQQKQLGAFSKKYPGITIEAFKLPPGAAVERAIIEARAGKLSVDVMDTNSGYLQLLFDRGLVRPYEWAKVFGVPDDQVLYNSRVIQIGHYDLPITYNTNLAKSGDLNSWNDLANVNWSGKFLLEARGFAFAILAQDWGLERTLGLVKSLVANKPVITRSATPTADALASGQAAAAVGALAARISLFKMQGAPTEWARVGPIPAQVVTIFPVHGGPHPNAAKLWAAWWAGAEAQKIFYDEQGFGLLTGPNANPRGKELQKLGIPIVFETANVEEGRRNLEVVAKAIEGIK